MRCRFAHVAALVAILGCLVAMLPCSVSEGAPGADTRAALHGAGDDSGGSPMPAPCTDNCDCLCGACHGVVIVRVAGPAEPAGTAAEIGHSRVDALHPGDHADRIFRPPLRA